MSHPPIFNAHEYSYHCFDEEKYGKRRGSGTIGGGTDDDEAGHSFDGLQLSSGDNGDIIGMFVSGTPRNGGCRGTCQRQGHR